MFLFLDNSSRSWSVRSYRDTWSCSERTPSSPSWVSVLIIDMTYWCTCTLTHFSLIQMASLHSVDIHWLFFNLMGYIYICHHPPPSCRHSLCFLSDSIYWLHPSCSLTDGSLEWETLEQYFLWQLISAHNIPVDYIMPVLPKLDYTGQAPS